jgi:hypothetical protein
MRVNQCVQASVDSLTCSIHTAASTATVAAGLRCYDASAAAQAKQVGASNSAGSTCTVSGPCGDCVLCSAKLTVVNEPSWRGVVCCRCSRKAHTASPRRLTPPTSTPVRTRVPGHRTMCERHKCCQQGRNRFSSALAPQPWPQSQNSLQQCSARSSLGQAFAAGFAGRRGALVCVLMAAFACRAAVLRASIGGAS